MCLRAYAGLFCRTTRTQAQRACQVELVGGDVVRPERSDVCLESGSGSRRDRGFACPMRCAAGEELAGRATAAGHTRLRSTSGGAVCKHFL